MNDELNLTMEKKSANRQSPVTSKSNVVSGEKKSDYISNKNGRQKKCRDSSNGSRFQEPSQQTPRTSQKQNRGGFGDKRPRQRGYFDHRPGEEVAESFGVEYDIPVSRKGKGNANHLLNFCYQDHSIYGSNYGSRARSYGARNVNRRYAPSYKKEQYLQASCQFIVQPEGDYALQAIDPDALVDWDTVQLVRTFSTEILTCPICLDVPIAAKITRCGHTYCWACILHYLHVNNEDKTNAMCPVCPEIIDPETLKSTQNMLVPDYKIGDDIEMRLMRKTKGSVFVCTEQEWTGKRKNHLNMNESGECTKFSKLLTATWCQVQTEVIDREKEALTRALTDAEPEEICFLQMALHHLEEQEQNMEMRKDNNTLKDSAKKDITCLATPNNDNLQNLPSDISFDGSKLTTQYADAFDETVADSETSCEEDVLGASVFAMAEMGPALQEDGIVDSHIAEHEMCTGTDSSKTQKVENGTSDKSVADLHDALTPEEAADHLELPEISSHKSSYQQKNRGPKDSYHFYQASTGQHIYLNSLNARCLDMEYGGLENSPMTLKAEIVTIERIFMTEDTRKRLRYLNHIPLTTEFHVVELKIKPPVVSKETIKHFQPEFEKRRKIRKMKAREEKIRAKKGEMEHKKQHGIYVGPDNHIPLDNAADFPSHLASLPEAHERRRKESTNSDLFHDSGTCDGTGSPIYGSPKNAETGTNATGTSFAQKLQGSSTGPVNSPPVWPRAAPSLTHSLTMPEMRGKSSVWGKHEQPEDDADDGYHAPSMASSWMSALHDLPSDAGMPAVKSPEPTAPSSGGKKKKKKSQTMLFATTMVRKG